MFRRRTKETRADDRGYAVPPSRTSTASADAPGDGPVYPAQRRGYGVTRAMMTLLGAAVAGLLIWIATQISDHSTGGYWAVYGLIAGAGLVMALSQLLGGWTKWGMPRISANVFLLAFIPVLIVAGWVVVAGQPHPNWFRSHILNWSSDIHVRGLVHDLLEYVSVLAFGIGLVFGYTFDTSGPRLTRPTTTRRRDVAGTTPAYDGDVAEERTPASGRDAGYERTAAPAYDGDVADEPTTAERETVGEDGRRGSRFSLRRGTPAAPQPEPEPAPRTTRDLD